MEDKRMILYLPFYLPDFPIFSEDTADMMQEFHLTRCYSGVYEVL